ncbi:Sbal_3080 family lipoprotein [Horticoccus sp. 23ND18S-11]|uniref:Sbal_3080 family lipoprotein n=1 Tax=Horticoccus sp. 23ND18S-11 TaxID=3391832 RepID=UPI0039C96951
MPKLIQSVLLAALLVTITSGCAIVQKVSPIESSPTISTIYIQKNPNVHMEGLLPEMVQQLTTLGFKVETFDTERPKDATHWMIFTANWQWDMAMYLTYFKATLMEDGKILGSAEYDARKGGGNMGKFGKTAEKIRPLLIELFQNAKRGTSSSATVGKSG